MVVVVHFTHHTMFYLPSMEPTISSTTQQTMVVQSAHYPIMHLTLLEPTTSLATQCSVLVGQSTYHPIVYLPSLELTTSTTQQNFIFCSVVGAISGFYYGNIVLIFMEPTISLATQWTTVVVQSMYECLVDVH